MAPQTIKGTLVHGLSISGEAQKDFELREATMADYFAAEAEAPIDRPLQFDAALLCQRLVRIGSFEGPFTVQMLGRLKPGDFKILRNAQAAADALGESESGPAPTG